MNYESVSLPRWLAVTMVVLRDLPATNAKLVFAMILAAATGTYLAISAVFRLPVDSGLLNNWYLFIGAWAALGTIQYGVKRATFKPGAPPSADDT